MMFINTTIDYNIIYIIIYKMYKITAFDFTLYILLFYYILNIQTSSVHFLQ